MTTGPSRSLTVAAVQPSVVAGDLEATVAAHAELVLAAGTRLVVFPELSLTGYELDAPSLEPDDSRLAALIDACRRGECVALAGAPIEEGQAEFIAMLVIDSAGARTAYRKVHLGEEERARFASGPKAELVVVDGWRVGLGVCKDTGVDEHVTAVAALNLDLYAAGIVHHPSELDEQVRRARTIAAATGAPVALASFAGATGGGYEATAGCSGIWSAEGVTLDLAGPEVGAIARATLSAAR